MQHERRGSLRIANLPEHYGLSSKRNAVTKLEGLLQELETLEKDENDIEKEINEMEEKILLQGVKQEEINIQLREITTDLLLDAKIKEILLLNERIQSEIEELKHEAKYDTEINSSNLQEMIEEVKFLKTLVIPSRIDASHKNKLPILNASAYIRSSVTPRLSRKAANHKLIQKSETTENKFQCLPTTKLRSKRKNKSMEDSIFNLRKVRLQKQQDLGSFAVSKKSRNGGSRLKVEFNKKLRKGGLLKPTFAIRIKSSLREVTNLDTPSETFITQQKKPSSRKSDDKMNFKEKKSDENEENGKKRIRRKLDLEKVERHIKTDPSPNQVEDQKRSINNTKKMQTQVSEEKDESTNTALSRESKEDTKIQITSIDKISGPSIVSSDEERPVIIIDMRSSAKDSREEMTNRHSVKKSRPNLISINDESLEKQDIKELSEYSMLNKMSREVRFTDHHQNTSLKNPVQQIQNKKKLNKSTISNLSEENENSVASLPKRNVARVMEDIPDNTQKSIFVEEKPDSFRRNRIANPSYQKEMINFNVIYDGYTPRSNIELPAYSFEKGIEAFREQTSAEKGMIEQSVLLIEKKAEVKEKKKISNFAKKETGMFSWDINESKSSFKFGIGSSSDSSNESQEIALTSTNKLNETETISESQLLLELRDQFQIDNLLSPNLQIDIEVDESEISLFKPVQIVSSSKLVSKPQASANSRGKRRQATLASFQGSPSRQRRNKPIEATILQLNQTDFIEKMRMLRFIENKGALSKLKQLGDNPYDVIWMESDSSRTYDSIDPDEEYAFIGQLDYEYQTLRDTSNENKDLSFWVSLRGYFQNNNLIGVQFGFKSLGNEIEYRQILFPSNIPRPDIDKLEIEEITWSEDDTVIKLIVMVKESISEIKLMTLQGSVYSIGKTSYNDKQLINFWEMPKKTRVKGGGICFDKKGLLRCITLELGSLDNGMICFATGQVV